MASSSSSKRVAPHSAIQVEVPRLLGLPHIFQPGNRGPALGAGNLVLPVHVDMVSIIDCNYAHLSNPKQVGGLDARPRTHPCNILDSIFGLPEELHVGVGRGIEGFEVPPNLHLPQPCGPFAEVLPIPHGEPRDALQADVIHVRWRPLSAEYTIPHGYPTKKGVGEYLALAELKVS